MDEKCVSDLRDQFPLLQQLTALDEVFWVNPNIETFQSGIKKCTISEKDVRDAEKRLERFAPYIVSAFPDTKSTNGVIESPLVNIPSMKKSLESDYQKTLRGELLLKCDSHLPISGSIKARGGIYEVLKHAEKLALQHKLLTLEDDYSIFDSDRFRDFFFAVFNCCRLHWKFRA